MIEIDKPVIKSINRFFSISILVQATIEDYPKAYAGLF